MDYIKINALRTQLDELARQIADLEIKGKAAEDSKNDHVLPALSLANEREYPSAYTQQCLSCSSRSSPDRRPNTCTAGRGVYLGLVRAGDVADLSERVLKELDDGLKAIAMHLVPRSARAPSLDSPYASFPRARQDMVTLLEKVSLRVGSTPGASEIHYSAFRNTARGRNFRLDDARLGHLGRIPDVYRLNALYFETFLQLVHFRGIDLEALS